MTEQLTDPSETLRALRKEFDGAFALAPHAQAQAMESMLAIRMQGQPYAIRLSDIAGLHADYCIVPLPAQAAQLLGVASFRGRMAPVYDLASLCGYARAQSARWLVLLRSSEPVALAFESFERHFSIPPQNIISANVAGLTTSAASAAHLQQAVRFENAVWPIVQLQSVLADIAQRCKHPNQPRDFSP